MHRNDISASTQERWRTIPDFPSYDVSDLGRVRSRKYTQPRVMKPRNVRGYRAVCLRRDNRSYHLRIPRLVLETFVGPCPDGCEAAHLDGSKTNDALDNLAWVTHQENIEHKRWHGTQTSGESHSRSKLTRAEVDEIRRLRRSGSTVRFLAKEYGLCDGTIYSLVADKHWTCVQFEARR